MEELLKPADAARIAGVSYPTLKQWIYKGKVQSVKTAGGHHRVARSEIERISGAARSKTQREKPIGIEFDFFASPIALHGENGHVRELEVERTRVETGRAVGTGETYRVPADIVVACIGYRSSPIPGVPFDERAGRFANDEGRILPGLYCVGWARRGPSGTIGTNRPDGYAVVDLIASEVKGGSGKEGRPGFDRLAQMRGLDVVTFSDWKKIEEAEEAAARAGSPREKFVDIESMIAARRT